MSRPLWTSEEIADATGGRVTGAFEATGVSIDTRSLEKGDLFVALKDIRDGHEFVPSAFEAGASAALVSREIKGVPGALIIVEDVMAALEAMGRYARERAKDAVRIAVTGSVGKTSVKEMIARIHRGQGKAHWSVKSFNNHWGVPLTLARMPAETEFAVFEIGMSTPGEIAPRSHMVQPHVAVITKIAPAHLEGLGSIEGVAREKADIAAGLVEPDGIMVLPKADPMLPVLAKRIRELKPDAPIALFGWRETWDRETGLGNLDGWSVIESYESVGGMSRIGLDTLTCQLDVEIHAVGAHWADNVACALLAARLNAPLDLYQAALDLSGYTPPPGRGAAEVLELPQGGRILLVDDAYNANPESMRAALASFASRKGRRHIVALGEMLEVGSTSEAEHKGLAEPVLASGASVAFFAGEGMKPLADSLETRIETHWAVNAKELDSVVKNSLTNGDLLLIKGSNASGMGLLADRLRQWSVAADGQVMDRGPEGAAGGMDAV
ncbi:UDP-N-acetylmuramoyl-tripeptide--D-alanyl-D-alanine ligase [Henriciella aquimarina]|uniref:UDP-N-acetylmuramoyl-tripeptide--D-alanyl-D- alanine ligase n=1 Tax=Henriciella aquimarina TaxID=545261 RepID=UPI0009FE22BA|nr:UDP-N-acetylmuramoyl-tripeptide--D-alanyl-D-alanine ligase [Henriciella aquimarina]